MNLRIVFPSAIVTLAIFIGCATAGIEALSFAPNGVMG
jgi:hypothetical protein